MNTRDAVEAGGRSFFVALPDTPRASALAARLAQVSTTRITHHSGRPWLLGHLTTDRLVTAQVGRTTAAIVGRSDATESRLRRLAEDISVPAQATAAASNFHGSYTTIVSVDGQIYASAAAMETRRIWSARIDGVLVLSDRADVLADLGEFDVDPAAVTIRLLGTMPHPLDRVPLWTEVEPLAGDRYITVDRNGERSRTGTWWYAPQADTSRSDGAVLFRSAVEGSVRARTAPGDPVACDLSGGLDSTPLCYFAAQAQQGVLARTLFNDDPGGREDLHWARRAIKSMPGVHTHEVTSTDDMQDFYEGVDSLDVRLDEPTQAATAGPRIVRMLADDRRKGIRMHITGLTGCFDAVHHRHSDVHENDVGGGRPNHVDALASVGRFADYPHLGARAEDQFQSGSHEALIIHQHNRYRHRTASLGSEAATWNPSTVGPASKVPPCARTRSRMPLSPHPVADDESVPRSSSATVNSIVAGP